MLSMEQFFLLLACMCGCGYTSYYLGFRKGGQVHIAVYMAVVEEFLSRKMGDEWFFKTFGKNNKSFQRYMEQEFENLE